MISNDLWLVIAGSTLLASDCAPRLVVDHDHDPAASFARLETFDWVRPRRRRGADPQVTNPFLDARIRRAIDAAMQQLGFRKAHGVPPDMLVTYYAATEARLDVTAVEEFAPWRWGAGAIAEAAVHEGGTLVIDIADAGTRRAIWRGWGRGAFDVSADVVTDEPRLRQAVELVLAAFPPAG